METIQINSTKDQLEEFRQSIIWNDFVRELESWKQGFTLELLSITDDAATTNPSTASLLLHIGDLNGRQKAVDYVLGLPDLFIQILEDKTKKGEENA